MDINNIKQQYSLVLKDIVFIPPEQIKKRIRDSTVDISIPRLTMSDFILSRNYDLSKMFVNTLWTKLNSFDTNDMILVDDEMYLIFGYKTRGDKCNNRNKFKRLLTGRTDSKTTLGLIEHVDYRIENLTPPAGGVRWGGHLKENIYITRKTFKKLCLKTNTQNSDRIHEYFLLIDDIFIEYIKYEFEYKIKKQEYELTIKDDKIDELSKQVNELLKKADHVIQQNAYNKTNNKHIKSITYNNKTKNKQRYYIIYTMIFTMYMMS